MSIQPTFAAAHSIVCNVPPARVYELIRRAVDWPQVFEPCRKVTLIEEGHDHDRIEVTALVNGVSMTWCSQRRFRPEIFAIESQLSPPMPLVRCMTTRWRVVPVNQAQSLLLLEHDYELLDDVAGLVEGVTTRAQAEQFIARAIDANSTTELGNIKAAVERPSFGGTVKRERQARHSIVCATPAASVYAIIRNTDNWPLIFDACLSATRIESTADGELVRIEALQEGQRVSWNTERRYYDAVYRIEFNLPVPMPFLARMSGEWRVVPLDAQHCLLTVDRSWRLLDEVRGIRDGIETVAQAAALVERFVEENAQAEMQAIRAFVEGQGEVLTSFTTRYRLPFPPDQVYGVLADARQWPQVLPHCEALHIVYDDARYQEFLMDVQTPRGVETFRSVRRCDEDSLSITYFQPQPPVVMRKHHGSWQVFGAEGGCEIVAHHAMQLDASACERLFGGTDLREHKQKIRELVGLNSRRTIDACAQWLASQPAAGAVS